MLLLALCTCLLYLTYVVHAARLRIIELIDRAERGDGVVCLETLRDILNV